MSANPQKRTGAKDFASDQEVRWCPGCGDYSVLAAVQRYLASLDVPREKHVFVSGIGCSSRFPYYMETYGFHTIHGRAPAIATGLAIANPELTVWVITGDGDALSIGGNHFIHLLRRNVNVNVLLFNNRIYGLTKGQYSPTSEQGKRTKSTPYGSLESPIDPVSIALGAQGSFIARALAVDVKGLTAVLDAARNHQGTSFVEIFQNCNVFNDKAFDAFGERQVRKAKQVQLEQGEPLVFGDNNEFAVALDSLTPTVVQRDEKSGAFSKEPLIFDRHNKRLAQLLSTLTFPDFPIPMGVLFQEERPTYERALHEQLEARRQQQGDGDLQQLLNGSDTWAVQ